MGGLALASVPHYIVYFQDRNIGIVAHVTVASHCTASARVTHETEQHEAYWGPHVTPGADQSHLGKRSSC